MNERPSDGRAATREIGLFDAGAFKSRVAAAGSGPESEGLKPYRTGVSLVRAEDHAEGRC
ncbi:hypothetical protein ACWEN3_31570 [Streptomyces sp. NPDC004561]